MNLKIKSEVFDNSYCIFIDKLNAFAYDNTVQKYKDVGVRIIEGNFEKAPACIVIPNKLDVFKIEKELYNIENSKNGFWGQFGIGYEGKTWKEI
jgi:hypothetical protein